MASDKKTLHLLRYLSGFSPCGETCCEEVERLFMAQEGELLAIWLCPAPVWPGWRRRCCPDWTSRSSSCWRYCADCVSTCVRYCQSWEFPPCWAYFRYASNPSSLDWRAVRTLYPSSLTGEPSPCRPW